MQQYGALQSDKKKSEVHPLVPCSDDHFHIFLSLKYTQALLYIYSQARAALIFLMRLLWGVATALWSMK